MSRVSRIAKPDRSGPNPLAVVLASCQRVIVGDVPTGGTTTATAPTNQNTEAEHLCRRTDCGRAAILVWTEQATGEVMAYCAEDGVEAFNLLTRWLREPEQRVTLDRYAAAVEKATGRGLYDQPPRYRATYDDDDSKRGLS